MPISKKIQDYTYIVNRVLNKYLKDDSYDMYRDDYMQIGLIALWNAIKEYDPAKNDNFEAFAYITIKNAVLDEIDKQKTQKRGGNSVTISLNAPCNITINGDASIMLEEVIEDRNAATIIDLENFFGDLTEDEFTIIRLKSQSKTVNEIRRITGFSKQKIVYGTQELKRKLKENVL